MREAHANNTIIIDKGKRLETEALYVHRLDTCEWLIRLRYCFLMNMHDFCKTIKTMIEHTIISECRTG